jgi:uncharacterized membrane protein
MLQDKPAWTDQGVDQVIGNLLRIGVIASALVVLAGGALYLVRHEPADCLKHYEPPEKRPPGLSRELCRPRGIVQAARTLSGRGLIQLGLLLLIATPVARVAFSVFAFARQRDYPYVAITLIVLAVLLYSLFSGGDFSGMS